jgi:arginine/ornithine N-succinyltransferase beta subunit
MASRPAGRSSYLLSPDMPDEAPSLRIRTDELRTVREAMRDFGSLLTELEGGEVEKLVLTQRNRVRAVVVSVERWSQLERELAERD